MPAASNSLRALCWALLLAGLALLLALPHQLQDLDVYRAGGAALLHGRDPYAVVAGPSRLPFTYPPFAALLALPLAVVPRWMAAVALAGGSGLALAVVARWLRLPVLLSVTGAVLLLEPVRSTLAYGQVNLLLLGLVVADLALTGGRDRGLLTGVAAAVKLTPLVFLGWLVVTRQWRAAATAIAGFLGAGLLAFAVAPGASRAYWGTYWRDQTRIGSAAYGSNQALSGLVARAEHVAVPRDAVTVSLTAVIGLAGLLVSGAWYRRDRDLSLCLAALTGLVVSPISWSHHWVWLLPAAVVMLRRAERTLRVVGGLLLGVAVLGVPSWWDRGDNREYLRGWRDLPFGETYLLAGLLCLIVSGIAAQPSIAFVCLLTRSGGSIRKESRAIET